LADPTLFHAATSLMLIGAQRIYRYTTEEGLARNCVILLRKADEDPSDVDDPEGPTVGPFWV